MISATYKSKNVEVQLAHPQNATTGAFKGPAKRSAFGDLSNTAGTIPSHNIPANGLGKYAVTAAKTTTKMVPYKDDNKENTVKNGIRKDAFLRPAQRPSNGVKTFSAGQSFPSQPVAKQNGARKSTLVYNDDQQQKHQSLSRQYRSQPQLKSTEPPVLRRSQSKHVMQEFSSNNADDDIDEAPYEDAVEEFPREAEANIPSWVAVSGMPGPIGPPIDAEMEPLRPVHVSGSGPSLPEPEEYWDDDDEEELYDEQGYTTAHSYKSYGDNTTGATTLVAPKRTIKVQRELEQARVFVESNRPQEDIEEEDWDVSMVAEYGEEIFEYMRELEVSNWRGPLFVIQR